MLIALAAFYLAAGVLHLTAPQDFVRIVPGFVPWPETVVWLTGWCEIFGAVGLLLPRLRRWAGAALALYAVCVFPANINHAFYSIDIAALPTSWWYHAPRLMLQPILVWWALFCSGLIYWPAPRR
ncbi:MAG: DoxX family protein [Alphaproteobacteria bacterium]|nr:DoxX family protein [Alphaproteobacteria bacterium]